MVSLFSELSSMMECFSFRDLFFSIKILNKKCSQRACRSQNLQFILKTEPVHPIPCSSAHSSSFTGTCLNSQENFGMAADVEGRKGDRSKPSQGSESCSSSGNINLIPVLEQLCFCFASLEVFLHLCSSGGRMFPQTIPGVVPFPAWLHHSRSKFLWYLFPAGKHFLSTEKRCTSGNVVE